MKHISLYTLLAILVLGTNSCEKDHTYTAERTFTDGTTTLLKIIYASAYTANPAIQLAISDVRVSGLITGRTPFPGGGYNTNGNSLADYLVVKPGSISLSGSIPKKLTIVDSVLLFKTLLNVDAGKNYTVGVADTFAKTRVAIFEDNLDKPAVNTSKYRFINLMPNVPLIDLYYGGTKVAAGIPYLGSSPYFIIPLQASATWSIRETGTLPTSTALATYASASTTTNQRIYTAFAMGYKGSTSAALMPYVSFLLNK